MNYTLEELKQKIINDLYEKDLFNYSNLEFEILKILLKEKD